MSTTKLKTSVHERFDGMRRVIDEFHLKVEPNAYVRQRLPEALDQYRQHLTQPNNGALQELSDQLGANVLYRHVRLAVLLEAAAEAQKAQLEQEQAAQLLFRQVEDRLGHRPMTINMQALTVEERKELSFEELLQADEATLRRVQSEAGSDDPRRDTAALILERGEVARQMLTDTATSRDPAALQQVVAREDAPKVVRFVAQQRLLQLLFQYLCFSFSFLSFFTFSLSF